MIAVTLRHNVDLYTVTLITPCHINLIARYRPRLIRNSTPTHTIACAYQKQISNLTDQTLRSFRLICTNKGISRFVVRTQSRHPKLIMD